MPVKVVEIALPGYTIKKKPDYTALGRKVDKVIEGNFSDGEYVVRAIGSSDHPNLSLQRLIQTITRKGTDKYDTKRKGVCHEEFSGYDYDIQAGKIRIQNGHLVIPNSYKYPTEFGDTMWHFYEHTMLDRGYAVRIDLLLIYDPKGLRRARKAHPKARSVRKGLNQYLYKFVDQKRKKDSLLGIVRILP
jgi:hypothetical protein